jgi:transposase
LLVAVRDTPRRLRDDAAFAALCGVSPVQASSGRSCGIGSTGAVTAS